MHMYALALLLFFSSTIAISQNCTYTLKGRVIDLHDNSGLAEADLVVLGTEQSVVTNSKGEFLIENLCTGSYSIQISHSHCSTNDFTAKITGNTTKNFRLEHHLEELNEIIVKGGPQENISKSILTSRISGEEIEAYSSGSLGDALNSLSGVSSLNTGSTIVKPIVNGLHSSRVLIINNGVRMEDQQWGAEHAPNIDINTAGNITLVKGAGALQFAGDAVGGIIISESAKVAVKDSLYGKTLFTGASNGRGATITSQLTKSYESGWYVTAQGTLKRFGDFEAPDYVLSNTGIEEQSASFKIGLNRFNYGFEAYYSLFKNEIGILSASNTGSVGDQFFAINNDQPLIIDDFTYNIDVPRQDVTHHLARLKFFKKVTNLGKIDFQYDFQSNRRLEFDPRRGENRDKASLDLELTTHSFLLNLDSKLNNGINIKSGLSTKIQNNFANPDTQVFRLIPDYDSFNFGAYAIADYNVNDKLTIEAGGRFDYSYIDAFKFYRTTFWESRGYDELFPDLVVEEFANQILTNPELSYSNFSATAGLTYKLGDKHSLFLNYSLASRAPNPAELFSDGLHHSTARFEIGDLNFTSEIANKVIVAINGNYERINFNVQPYINTVKDFILIEPSGFQTTTRGSFPVWEYRQTDVQLLGFDIDASYKITKNLDFTHQFSFVKGYEQSSWDPIIDMPPVSTKNEITYQNQKLNNLRLSLQSEYVFSQNEFPDNNFEVFIPVTDTNELLDISTPPDAYHLLHFNSDIDVNINKKSTLKLGFKVANLLDTSYRSYLNQLRYYADDLGRNFLLNIKINY